MLNKLSSSFNTMLAFASGGTHPSGGDNYDQKTVDAALEAPEDCHFGENCKWQRNCKFKHIPLEPIDVSVARKSKVVEPSLNKETERTQYPAKSSEDDRRIPSFEPFWAMVDKHECT
jgi:hypothetical protein